MNGQEGLSERSVWRTVAAGTEAVLRFLPRAPAGPGEEAWLRIAVDLGQGAAASVYAPFDAVGLVAGRREPGLSLGPDLDESDRALALEFVFVDLVEAIEGLTGRPLRVERADIRSRPEERAVAILAQVAGVEAIVLVALPPAAEAALARFVAGLPREPFAVDGLGGVASLRVGASSLTLDELGLLRPGDGILVQSDARTRPVLVLGERRLADTVLEDGAAILTSAPRDARTPADAFFLTEPDSMDDEARSGDLRRVSDLTLTVVFEAARRRIPVSELERLDVGHRFALPPGESDLVGILVGGRRIGTGRLVDIEGGVVVEVVALAP